MLQEKGLQHDSVVISRVSSFEPGFWALGSAQVYPGRGTTGPVGVLLQSRASRDEGSGHCGEWSILLTLSLTLYAGIGCAFGTAAAGYLSGRISKSMW